MQLGDFLKEDYKNISVKNIADFKNKTIFITGGNGLIGSNILCYLDYANKKFDLNIKFLVHSFSKPEKWLPKGENITYFNSDLNTFNEDLTFDYLFHTATYGQPKKFIENKLGTVKLNTETYIKLLDMAKKNNARVLMMSSSEVYGQIPKELIPVKENYNGNVCTLLPRAVYAESKRLSETISQIYIDEGLDVKLIRLAIGYGAGVKYSDTRFINEFIKKALNEGEIKMMDEGKAIRHIGFVTDVVEMILNILLNGKETVYNIGGDEEVTIFQIAEMIAQKTGVKVVLPSENDGIKGTPNALVLDISRYKNEFGKTNFVPSEYGIEKTIEWIKLIKE